MRSTGTVYMNQFQVNSTGKYRSKSEELAIKQKTKTTTKKTQPKQTNKKFVLILMHGTGFDIESMLVLNFFSED